MDEMLKKMLEDQEREMAMGYTDNEIMKRVNDLLNEESQRMRDDCLDENMSALIMQCMQEEEDTHFMDITMSVDDYLSSGDAGFHYMPPVATYTDLPHSSSMQVGDTIYIEEWEEAYTVMQDTRGRRWVKTHGNSFATNPCSEITLAPQQQCTEFTHFNGEPIEPIEPISKNVLQILRPRYDLVMEYSPIGGINVDKLMKYLNTAIDEALAPKNDKRILSSRTASHEYVIEKRAENDLRRRNAGKRILSSRD